MGIVPSVGRRGQAPLAYTSAVREETIQRAWNFLNGLYLKGSPAASLGAAQTWTGMQTFRDNAFEITDDLDTSKIVAFNLNNLIVGTSSQFQLSGNGSLAVRMNGGSVAVSSLGTAFTANNSFAGTSTFTGTSSFTGAVSMRASTDTTILSFQGPNVLGGLELTLIDATYTQGVGAAGMGSMEEGVVTLAPTFSGGLGNFGFLTLLGLKPTFTGVIDSQVHGVGMTLTASLHATDAGGTTMFGLRFNVDTAGTSGSSWTGVVGIGGTITHNSGDNVTLVSGASTSYNHNTATTLTNYHGYRVAAITVAAGTISNCYGFRIANPTGAGTITTLTGLRLENLTKGGTNYAIDSAGGQSRHVGNFFIGAATNPTAKLHLGAGTTAASTAPLKFTTGTNMTTAEAGAVEFTTDDLYFTITTGAARKGIILNDGSNLTSGRVPFATTNGRLTDDADMTFATDTLTVTKIAATTLTGNLTFADAINVITNGTTGTKIGTATSQKIGFWNAAPIIQPTTAVAAATFVANTSGIVNDTATWDGYTVGQVVKALRNAGLLA